MKDGYYLKCSCKSCGGRIEFPATGEGATVNCPHCGQPTRLLLDEPAKKPPARHGAMAGTVAAVVCLFAAAMAAFYIWHSKKSPALAPQPPTKIATVHTNPPAIPPPARTTDKPAGPKRKKSASDLKVSEIKLEKTKGSSLVYAVGTVTNDSDYQRFGVKVELDVFDAEEKKVGKTQDYIGILEPRREWQFRALILESHAATAKVSTLKEEE
jgi:hypothetical protein